MLLISLVGENEVHQEVIKDELGEELKQSN
jgi:hypothetical protein